MIINNFMIQKYIENDLLEVISCKLCTIDLVRILSWRLCKSVWYTMVIIRLG